MSLQNRADRVAEITFSIIDALTMGSSDTIEHSTDILSMDSNSVTARWKAALLLDADSYNPPIATLPGTDVASIVYFEERTIRLTWPTAEACSAATDEYEWEWVQTDKDHEGGVPWDSPEVTPSMVESALEHIDAEVLIEWFGSIKDIDYSEFPVVFQAGLRAMVEAIEDKST
jgi:hypothetical protein